MVQELAKERHGISSVGVSDLLPVLDEDVLM